jgi:hypothetical protein
MASGCLAIFGQQHARGASKLAASIVGHLQFEIADHVEVLSILACERESFFERGGGD